MVPSSNWSAPARPSSEFSELIDLDPDWLCPDLRPHWKLLQVRSPTTGDEPAAATPAIKVLLRSRQFPQLQHEFTAVEGYALQRFAGDRTLQGIQQACQREFPHLSPHFVLHLVARLATLGVLSIQTGLGEIDQTHAADSASPPSPLALG